jgi:hypothetical protein
MGDDKTIKVLARHGRKAKVRHLPCAILVGRFLALDRNGFAEAVQAGRRQSTTQYVEIAICGTISQTCTFQNAVQSNIPVV